MTSVFQKSRKFTSQVYSDNNEYDTEISKLKISLNFVDTSVKIANQGHITAITMNMIRKRRRYGAIES